mmetsp:Transcript_7530/g.12952  ORF Transcript_7530/g.12952 Transcript_7530/m.12952 type:complete len:201 (+) Transcript_7530:1612-2214(+)
MPWCAITTRSGGRGPRSWGSPSTGPAARQRRTSSSCTRSTRPSRRRLRSLPGRCTRRPASSTCQRRRRRSRCTRGRASTSSPSAWPRPSTPSLTTPPSRARPPTLCCQSATCAPLSAPASCTLWSATCPPSPACPPCPPTTRSTLTSRPARFSASHRQRTCCCSASLVKDFSLEEEIHMRFSWARLAAFGVLQSPPTRAR